MSAFFFADKRMSFNGTRLVHQEGCLALPQAPDRIFLGTFLHMTSAVQTARIRYFGASPCLLCLAIKRND